MDKIHCHVTGNYKALPGVAYHNTQSFGKHMRKEKSTGTVWMEGLDVVYPGRRLIALKAFFPVTAPSMSEKKLRRMLLCREAILHVQT